MQACEIHRAWRELPFADTGTIFGIGRTLVLAPHPDDESLGCGGAIAQLCRAGRPPLVAILTNGAGSHPNSRTMPPAALRRLRQTEAAHAVATLGLLPSRDLVFLDLPDTAAPHEGDAFERAIARVASIAEHCATICAPWHGDPHNDHLSAHLIAVGAARLRHLRHLAYPVWGWCLSPDTAIMQQQVHGWRLDIRANLRAKRAAIAAHRSQYGQVITDDPAGFTLPRELLAACTQPYEVFLTP
ncbi:MAG TPA: PIG-L deacetylase family protein [Acetobacteraceae bacterium]|nr:PIG-L deacetylase family protein [Acetobacteraceae bacterium]